MNPKKMGEFIAVLRKSKGFTQQEVGERLNISNKTVSKWERGEGYPEISMIPAIAELFQVSTDEIFRGERILPENLDIKQNTASVEKQKERLINSSKSKFKNQSYIALALIIIGLGLLYGITYSSYKPVLAGSITYILTAIAVIFQLITSNNFIASIRSGDILEEQDPRIINAYRVLYRFNALVVISAIIVMVLVVPLLGNALVSNGVISLGLYLKFVPASLFISGFLCYFGLKTIKPTLKFSKAIKASVEEISPVKTINRRLVRIVISTLVVTLLTHGWFHWRVALPGRLIFTETVQFEEFIKGYEEYHFEKEQWESEGLEYPHYSARFENVNGWDDKRMVVFRKYSDDVLVGKTRYYLLTIFGYIYLIEMAMLGFLLLAKEMLWQ